MKRKRHMEEQITAILKEHEAGIKTAKAQFTGCKGISHPLILIVALRNLQ